MQIIKNNYFVLQKTTTPTALFQDKNGLLVSSAASANSKQFSESPV